VLDASMLSSTEAPLGTRLHLTTSSLHLCSSLFCLPCCMHTRLDVSIPVLLRCSGYSGLVGPIFASLQRVQVRLANQESAAIFQNAFGDGFAEFIAVGKEVRLMRSRARNGSLILRYGAANGCGILQATSYHLP